VSGITSTPAPSLGLVPKPRRRDMLKGLIERSVTPHAENRFDGEGRTQHSILAFAYPAGSESPFSSCYCAAFANRATQKR
jgi:hypothetical protein